MTTRTEAAGTRHALEQKFGMVQAEDDLSSHAERQFIGALGLVLPVLLWIIAGWRPTKGLPREWEILDSISAYYYTGAVAVFVGVLFVLGIYLLTYQGYNNEYHRRDRCAAIVAGIAAIMVASFPTRAPNDALVLPWWTPGIGTIHYTSAVILFSAFSFFSLVLFRKSKGEGARLLSPDKRARNRIYTLCGIAILVCMLWAGSSYFTGTPIFWPEALALEFFAVSWLVKGRVDRTALVVSERAFR